MTLSMINRIVGTGDPEKRIKDDFYATPDWAIDALLDREKFEGEIWEPACGDGAISKKLISRGYDTYSSDLVDRGYGDAHFNFLNSLRETDNIVTNPPFKLGTKFTLHALKLAKRKVAMFNKLTFLEGKERRDNLFNQGLLSKVYVFSERVGFNPKDGKQGGMLAFAWFVFDNQYLPKSPPSLYWI